MNTRRLRSLLLALFASASFSLLHLPTAHADVLPDEPRPGGSGESPGPKPPKPAPKPEDAPKPPDTPAKRALPWLALGVGVLGAAELLRRRRLESAARPEPAQ